MLKLIEQIETGSNPMGLCGLASAEKAKSKSIAVPNSTKGAIKVLTYGKILRVFSHLKHVFSGRKVYESDHSGS